MNISLIIKDKVNQIVFEPESKQEETILQLLRNYTQVRVVPGVRVYSTQGGYLRSEQDGHSTLAIVMSNESPASQG